MRRTILNHATYSKKCREFVKRVCHKRTDESHSVKHMERVVETCKQILKEDYAGESGAFWSMTVICAWLHDVQERKYPDENNQEEMINFLKSLNLEKDLGIEYTNVLNIIDYVSFSKENAAILAGKPLDFEAILCTPTCPYAHLIRQIVSDADKLDAIGDFGVVRADQTAIHLYEQKHGKKPDRPTVVKLVNDHAQEKLLKLHEFIRTKHGKKLAENSQISFVKKLEEYNRLANVKHL